MISRLWCRVYDLALMALRDDQFTISITIKDLGSGRKTDTLLVYGCWRQEQQRGCSEERGGRRLSGGATEVHGGFEHWGFGFGGFWV